MKTLQTKTSAKEERQKRVLLGLVDLYLQDGAPVGSGTLQANGFQEISPATIRNYFSQLERDGYLQQQHVSGGRIPTQNGLRFYAREYREWDAISENHSLEIDRATQVETKEVATYLQKGVETLSHLTNCAVFISAPRFDHDFIRDIKLVAVDRSRVLCVILTEFGSIQTEVLQINRPMSTFSIKRMEHYFQWRLFGRSEPDAMSEEEKYEGQKLYNEILVRYIVSYSNFIREDIFRMGFSKLLTFPDYHDSNTLTKSLALFENARSMALLLRESMSKKRLKFWIEDDLAPYTDSTPKCAVVAHPYSIHTQAVGGVGVLGPSRIPYKELFGILRYFSHKMSSGLTRNIYKYKIQHRNPQTGTQHLEHTQLLLEDQRTQKEG